MTAKEKAEELMYTFSQIIPASSYEAYEGGVRINFDLEHAKQCALITVEELIKENYPQDIKRCIYLHNVKREIELL